MEIDTKDIIALLLAYFGVAVLVLVMIGVSKGWWCPPFICIKG